MPAACNGGELVVAADLPSAWGRTGEEHGTSAARSVSDRRNGHDVRNDHQEQRTLLSQEGVQLWKTIQRR